MRTEMDYLVIGNIIFDQRKQPPRRKARSWKDEYGLV
jgi:hypothetical protein